MSRTRDATEVKVSREEIETLCVLFVVGDDGCPVGELAQRLGLSPTLNGALAGAMNDLIDRDLLACCEGQFVLTENGAYNLETRLSALGVLR